MAGEQAQPAPKSWASDLQQYRDVRGSRSFATIDQTGGGPKRCSRTNCAPFANPKHRLAQGDDYKDGTVQPDPDVQHDRCSKHGWGDVSLLKEDGYAGIPHASGQQPARSGKAMPSEPRAADGRQGLTEVLQMTGAGGQDSWIGHRLIDPTKGKRAVQGPCDPKGRRDLFDVLQARNPGVPADDSWMGNTLVDPAKGRGSAPGPEQLRGRRDLNDIMAQSVLRDPNRAALLSKGADPVFRDAWCGHRLIDPYTGKLPVHNVAASEDTLRGATFKQEPPLGWSDAPRRHTALVERNTNAVSAADVMSGTVAGDDWGRLSRRPGTDTANRFDGRTDLYGHMQYRELNKAETAKLPRAWDDAGCVGKRSLHAPGGEQGSQFLHWRPEQRCANFVPYGGLMYESRRGKGQAQWQ